MVYFRGEYSFSLNLEDCHNQELPPRTNRAKGGTLNMWKSYHDQYITVCNTDSPAYLPIVVDIPGIKISIHVALYLPTAGKDAEFLAEMAALKIILDNLLVKYRSPVIFLRGDANSSTTNTNRNLLLQDFCSYFHLNRVVNSHKTYHHLTGDGAYDCVLEVLLFSDQFGVKEEITNIVCSLLSPHVDSHNDVLVSSCSVPSRIEAP